MANMKTIPRVAGFNYATLAAGIKKPGKLDLGLIYSQVPARCAGVFTTNKVVAAPVTLTAARIKRQRCQAILVNSGNANACTGETGLQDARHSAELLATALGIDTELVAIASTGVIGKPLPMEKLAAAIPRLPASLSPDGAVQLAESIMTTDSFAKLSAFPGWKNCRSVRFWSTTTKWKSKGTGVASRSVARKRTIRASFCACAYASDVNDLATKNPFCACSASIFSESTIISFLPTLSAQFLHSKKKIAL